jgi:hypothetical protein
MEALADELEADEVANGAGPEPIPEPAVCPSCGIGGGHHVADCEAIA